MSGGGLGCSAMRESEADKSLRMLHETFMQARSAEGMTRETIAAWLLKFGHKRPDGEPYTAADVEATLDQRP